MNSIETYTVPKVAAMDGDTQDLLEVRSDPLALEAMRALMVGIAPLMPQPQSQMQPENAPQPSVRSSVSAPLETLVTLLSSLASDETLPESLKPLVAALTTSLSSAPATVTTEAEATPNLSALQAAISQTSTAPAATALAATTPNATPLPVVVSQSILLSPETTELAKQLVAALDTTVATVGPKPNPMINELRAELVQALAVPEEKPVHVPLATTESTPSEASLGQSILQSLGAQSSTSITSPIPTPGVNQTPTVERVEQVSALMTEMADRVLVTDPIHGQVPEVRVKLADSIMPGTEVRVWREDGGQLRVEFDTVSPYWARVLNEASPLLTQRLNERLPSTIPAEVFVQQQGGQPEDGRSRNRQNPWEIMQQNAEA